MEIIITEWALNAYLDMTHNKVFSDSEYRQTIRPDALLLKDYPNGTKFQQGKFWSPTGNRIPGGFKMKWHQIGNGKVQLRLPVGILSDAFLCAAYVKNNPKKEKRKLAIFKTHLELIRKNRYTECGRLT